MDPTPDPKRPKSDAERAAYAERLVTDAVARLDANPPPLDLDPEPIPNIVLHPGDTLAIEARTDNGERLTVRLIDRHLNPYAVLDCLLYDGGWRIHAIRFVAAGSGRGLLPVLPEPDTDGDLVLGRDFVPDTVSATYDAYGRPVTAPHQHSTTSDDPDRSFGVNSPPTHGDARPRNLILSHFGRVTDLGPTGGADTDADAADLSSLTVTHAHPHKHLGDGITFSSTPPPDHTHDHQHTGTEALSRAHVFGHWHDPHDHHHTEHTEHTEHTDAEPDP